MRERLPDHANGPFVLTGPAGLVLELVTACLTRTVTHLAVGLLVEPGVDPVHFQ